MMQSRPAAKFWPDFCLHTRGIRTDFCFAMRACSTPLPVGCTPLFPVDYTPSSFSPGVTAAGVSDAPAEAEEEMPSAPRAGSPPEPPDAVIVPPVVAFILPPVVLLPIPTNFLSELVPIFRLAELIRTQAWQGRRNVDALAEQQDALTRAVFFLASCAPAPRGRGVFVPLSGDQRAGLRIVLQRVYAAVVPTTFAAMAEREHRLDTIGELVLAASYFALDEHEEPLPPQLQGEVRAAFDLVHRHCRRPNEPKKKKGRGGAKKKKKRAGRNGRKRLKNAFELLALHNITSDLLSSRHAVFQEQLRAHHERLQRRFEELKLTASEHDFAE